MYYVLNITSYLYICIVCILCRHVPICRPVLLCVYTTILFVNWMHTSTTCLCWMYRTNTNWGQILCKYTQVNKTNKQKNHNVLFSDINKMCVDKHLMSSHGNFVSFFVFRNRADDWNEKIKKEIKQEGRVIFLQYCHLEMHNTTPAYQEILLMTLNMFRCHCQSNKQLHNNEWP